ncbi:MAG: hypothetical protein BGO98_25025 [Myxococcales bacterium 68-20]|nr:MAG: hypothetical protein BGO98_25025 [Myxococcales bacterium 68-20]
MVGSLRAERRARAGAAERQRHGTTDAPTPRAGGVDMTRDDELRPRRVARAVAGANATSIDPSRSVE